MRQKLKDELLAQYPRMRQNLAERYVRKYTDAVIAELATRMAIRSEDEEADGELNFAAEQVRNASGRCEMDGKMAYAYTVMQEHIATSLVICTYIGNSIKNRVSRVIINPLYKAQVMQDIKQLAIDGAPLQRTEQQQLADIQIKANKRVLINAASLASYIAATRSTLSRNDLDMAYEEKIIGNLRTANYLMDIAYEQDGVCYVDEYWDAIDSGRTHGHGKSMQRIAKEVRHAALGQCYRYDLKAASYALMTALAKGFDTELKTAGLEDYVQRRSLIRKRIANDVGISVEWMKEIFTALGFGAELKDNPYNAIRKKLGQEKYHKLIANAEFALISKQLKAVSQAIVEGVGDGDFEFFGMTYCAIDPKDGSKRTKNQMLAWIYQCFETQVMTNFVALIPSDYKVLLTVHDCVYLDRPMHYSKVQDIKQTLRRKYGLVDFEGEQIVPIHESTYVDAKIQKHADTQRQHKELIAAQERAALDYVPMYCTNAGSGQLSSAQ